MQLRSKFGVGMHKNIKDKRNGRDASTPAFAISGSTLRFTSASTTLATPAPRMNITMPVAWVDPSVLVCGAPQAYIEVPSLRTPAIRPPRFPKATQLPNFILPVDEVAECAVSSMVVAVTSLGNMANDHQNVNRMVPSHQRYTVSREMQLYFDEQCAMDTELCPAFWHVKSSTKSPPSFELSTPSFLQRFEQSHSAGVEEVVSVAKCAEGDNVIAQVFAVAGVTESYDGVLDEMHEAGAAVAALAHLAEFSQMMQSEECTLDIDHYPVLFSKEEVPVVLQQDVYTIMVDCFSSLADLSSSMISGADTEFDTMPVTAALHAA